MTSYIINSAEASTVQQNVDEEVSRVDGTRMGVVFTYDCECTESVNYNVAYTTSEEITSFLDETAKLRAGNHPDHSLEDGKGELVSSVEGLELNTSVTV